MRTPRLRLLSVLLAVALFFTLLPVSALAEVGGSNANTGLTIGIVGGLNKWDVSHSISMKEVSPAVYEVTFENKSYGDINGSVGFLFVKDNKYDDVWGFGAVSSGELQDAFYYGNYIQINPGSDDESAVRNFIVRLDLTNWDWGTITGATFTITVTAPSRDFTFDATTGTIKKYNGNDAVVNIPSEINGTPVTTIGNAAFRDSSVTSVTIPASVTEIGANAFAGCTNLTSVNYIGGDWSKLTIQSGNPAVEDAAKDAANEQLFDFEFILNNTAVIVISYKGTAADVTIPSRYKGKPVTMIDHAAFPNSAVTSVTIPDSVTSIPDAAFYNCGNLETIHIPVSVTFIGSYAFDDCPNLMTVTYSGSKTQWDKINGKDELLNIPSSATSWKPLLRRTAQRLLPPRPLTAAKSLRNPLNPPKKTTPLQAGTTAMKNLILTPTPPMPPMCWSWLPSGTSTSTRSSSYPTTVRLRIRRLNTAKPSKPTSSPFPL